MSERTYKGTEANDRLTGFGQADYEHDEPLVGNALARAVTRMNQIYCNGGTDEAQARGAIWTALNPQDTELVEAWARAEFERDPPTLYGVPWCWEKATGNAEYLRENLRVEARRSIAFFRSFIARQKARDGAGSTEDAAS